MTGVNTGTVRSANPWPPRQAVAAYRSPNAVSRS